MYLFVVTGTWILFLTFQKMKMPVVTSATGKEFLKDKSCETVYVVEEFDTYEFMDLLVNGARILGPPIIMKKAEEDQVNVFW